MQKLAFAQIQQLDILIYVMHDPPLEIVLLISSIKLFSKNLVIIKILYFNIF